MNGFTVDDLAHLHVALDDNEDRFLLERRVAYLELELYRLRAQLFFASTPGQCLIYADILSGCWMPDMDAARSARTQTEVCTSAACSLGRWPEHLRRGSADFDSLSNHAWVSDNLAPLASVAPDSL